MLSYRHAYHAGNHADVLKHLCLIALLRHFAAKDSPFCYLDTHSGKGFYDLRDSAAQKNREFASGVEKIWQVKRAQDPLLSGYLDLLRSHPANSKADKLNVYPGSPAIATALMRPQDKLLLMELHGNEFELLKNNFKQDARIHLHQRDGFEGLAALVPPTPRRGFALIDPAYEVKADYEAVVTCVKRVYRKWQTGVVAIWFPLLGRARDRSTWLKQRIREAGFADVLLAELTIAEQDPDMGMHGSGIIVVNAPWRLDEVLEHSLKEAGQLLQAQTQVGWLNHETSRR